MNKSVMLDACDKARKEPYVVQEIYVNDFKLMIHWDEQRQWFECCLHWSPCGSSYYNYGRTESDLMREIENRMNEFGGKGNYKKYSTC